MRSVIAALAKGASQLGDGAIARVAVKSVGITLVAFVALGLGLWWVLDAAIEAWVIDMLPEDYSNIVAGIVAFAVGGLAAWLLFRVVALAVLQFFADEIVAAVEARHYPDACANAKALPFKQDLANSLRGMARALLFNLAALPVALLLLFTAIGPAVVFLLVNAVLLGRELTDMAWIRHCEGDISGNPVSGVERVLLGAAIAALMLVPFANLIAPLIGAAAGTHLVHSAMTRKEGAHA